MLDRLRVALREVGQDDVEPILERVETSEGAEHLRFVGSPTVLIEGRDPFAVEATEFGLACRIYQTATGPAGSPTVEELLNALRTT